MALTEVQDVSTKMNWSCSNLSLQWTPQHLATKRKNMHSFVAIPNLARFDLLALQQVPCDLTPYIS